MEGDGVAFALPLVAAPELVEFFGPVDELVFLVLGVDGADDLERGPGAFFVADGGTFQGVEDGVGHEIVLVGLLVSLGAEFGGGVLNVDVGEGFDRGTFGEALGFHPTEPLAEVVFVDAGDGAEAAGGVAIHGGVADSGFGAVAGGKKKGVADVGEHPDAGGADAGLDVLAGDVVLLPAELSSEYGFDRTFVAFDQFVDFPLGVVAVEGSRDGPRGVAGGVAGVFGALVGAEEERLHPVCRFRGEVEVGESFADSVFAEVVEGEVEHDFHEGGNGGGVGPAAERNDESAGPAFAKVIKVGEGHGAGEFLLLGHGGDGGVAVPAGDLRPLEGNVDFGEALDVDLAAHGAGLVKTVALDVDGLVDEGGLLEREAGAFGRDFPGGGDESAAIVDGASGLVTEEVGVDVGGSEGAGALDDELFTDFLLAEGEVAGGGVEDDIDSAAGEEAAGAVGNPGVFTDFEADADAVDFEDGVSDGEGVVAEAVFDNDAVGPGVEPAGFVVEAIAGEVFLGDEASDFTVDEDGDGVVDGIFDPDREPNGDDHFLGFDGDFGEAGPGSLGDFVGEELVLTAVAGDGEFGEAEDGDVGGAGLGDGFEDAAAVAGPVEGDLVEAACADADGVAHGKMMNAERRTSNREF